MKSLKKSSSEEIVMNKPVHELRMLLNDMEKELGLSDMSAPERDILYVIESLSVLKKDMASHLILSHELSKKHLGQLFIGH